jgi:hypothetical protein
MKLIGNYKTWVDPQWFKLTMELPGKPRPNFNKLINSFEKHQYKEAEDAGYNFEKSLWTIYEKDDLELDIVFPWCTGKTAWWITKLMPGQYMPMHSDPFTHDAVIKRYWVPLMDYEPGHIFIYKDDMIKDYKLGDLYQFDNAIEMHGAANISYSPRIMLQVSEYL